MRHAKSQLTALVLVALVLTPSVVTAQDDSWETESYEVPTEVTQVVEAMWDDAHGYARHLVELYNETGDEDLAFALSVLHSAETHKDAGRPLLALDRLREYYPAATYAKLRIEADDRNLTGADAVAFVLNHTEAEHARSTEEAAALRQRLHDAQAAGVDLRTAAFLLTGSALLAEGNSYLNQYATFRSALQQEGAWEETAVQGSIGYSEGPQVLYEFIQRLLNATSPLDDGPTVGQDDFAALVDRTAATRDDHIRHGGRWLGAEWKATNGTDEHLYRLGVYAADNGTHRFNTAYNDVYSGKMSLSQLNVLIRGNALGLRDALDAAAEEGGVDHPYPAMVTDLAFLTTKRFSEAPQEQKKEFTSVLPGLFGRVVTAVTLYYQHQALADSSADAEGGETFSLARFALVAGALVGVAGAAVLVARRR